jgi:hypothetical protein
MTDLGPWMIAARNAEQAEYVVRSRAEQRGVSVSRVDVSGGDGGMWRVMVTVTETVQAAEAARLGDDTQAIHLDIRAARNAPPAPG